MNFLLNGKRSATARRSLLNSSLEKLIYDILVSSAKEKLRFLYWPEEDH